jgi:hypothetical protein
MAKRAPADETPYSPLDITLAQSVVKGAHTPQDARTSPVKKTAEHPEENFIHGQHSIVNRQIVEMPSHNKQLASLKATVTRNLHREKRVLLTAEEERQVERLVDRIAEQLGTSLKLSHLLRACMALLCHAEGEIIRHTSGLHPLPRPANGDAVALAQFENALAKLLSKSLRDAPAIR